MNDDPGLKERVLREAEAALRQDGFFGFSLRQVARSVGASPGTVGYLFGGKQGLLKAAEARMGMR
jgi:AcrR family transcriptional regulator